MNCPCPAAQGEVPGPLTGVGEAGEMPASRETGPAGGTKQTAELSRARWLAILRLESLGLSEPEFLGVCAGAAAGDRVALARWLCSPAAPRRPAEVPAGRAPG